MRPVRLALRASVPPCLRAFTLIEMTVVIAIIILLAGLVVPAATQIWRDRKIADAQNIITGMLMTARARAIQSGGAETGLFFFVDEQGVQHAAEISQNPNDPAADPTLRQNTIWRSDPNWYNVFTVLRNRSYTMPAPMRVLPRYAVCGDAPEAVCPGYTETFNRFEEDKDELGNNNFLNPTNSDPCQRHRNYFTVIFSGDGELKVGRDVILRDADVLDVSGQPLNRADVTGLPAWDEDGGAAALTYKTWKNEDARVLPSVDPLGGNSLDNVLIDDTDTSTALNFPSVDGLLVYDDSLFNEASDAAAKRKYLMDFAMPFYINRITGAVVRGPTGEGPTP